MSKIDEKDGARAEGAGEIGDALMKAALDCFHTVSHDCILLSRDAAVPGNALAQLHARLADSAPAKLMLSQALELERRDVRESLLKAELIAARQVRDGLVAALKDIAQPANAGCGCDFPCRCDCPEAEATNAEEMREIASAALAAVEAV